MYRDPAEKDQETWKRSTWAPSPPTLGRNAFLACCVALTFAFSRGFLAQVPWFLWIIIGLPFLQTCCKRRTENRKNKADWDAKQAAISSPYPVKDTTWATSFVNDAPVGGRPPPPPPLPPWPSYVWFVQAAFVCVPAFFYDLSWPRFVMLYLGSLAYLRVSGVDEGW